MQVKVELCIKKMQQKLMLFHLALNFWLPPLLFVYTNNTFK